MDSAAVSPQGQAVSSTGAQPCQEEPPGRLSPGFPTEQCQKLSQPMSSVSPAANDTGPPQCGDSPRGCCCPCAAACGILWGHSTVTGSSLTAPSRSTTPAEGRGIIPNKTGMRKSAECWAVGREACTADSPSCHHPGHLKPGITGEKLPFPGPHRTTCLTSAHGPIPSPEPEQSLTSPPVSAHSPSTKPFAGRGQLLPRRAEREWENTRLSVGSAGMSRRKAGRQLWNPPLPSLPAGNSRIIPNIACGQGALGSFSIIPELRNTSCPQG